MVSTIERISEKSPMEVFTPGTTNKPSTIKYLSQLSEPLYVKNRTYLLILGAAKANHNSTIKGESLWSIIKYLKGSTKIYDNVKQALYNCILQHP